MKVVLAAAVALATAFASSAYAAPPKHRAPVDRDTLVPYAQGATVPYAAHQPDVVMLGNRVVGEDPDPAIRTQLLHDPVPSEY